VLLWIGGLASAFVASAATIGLGEALRIEQDLGIDARFLGFLPGAAWSLTLNLVIAGTACVIVSRRRAGNLHLLRAVAGQAALGFLLFIAFQLARSVRVEQGGGIQYWGNEESLFLGAIGMLALLAAGVVLVAWPLRSARWESFAEANHGR
jgi:hypothetical protein